MTNDRYDDLAAQTVIDLADHMRRLRSEAERLQSVFETRQRGFFTPSEDDQVFHHWISYHKARNALLDLIDSIRRSAGSASEETMNEFIVAYAAALVLVDAARSLRDLFGDNQLVRRKLNESCHAYGIGAGSFDKIQMALTDPANALRLNAANDFFDRYQERIRRVASQHDSLGAVMTVVDDLSQGTRVSSARYIRAMAIERGHSVKSQVFDSVFDAVYAIQELGSRLVSNIRTMPNHVPRLPEPIQAQLLAILQPGDVFITRKENALTNYFLPGYWPHAALYIGGQRVIESLKDGVRERTMDSPLGNDAVAVIRPQLSAETIAQAIARARTHVGKPYDFDFDFTRSDRIVCTEVVYRSYEGLDGIRFQLSRRAGRETLSAEDLLCLAMDHSYFEQVAVFCPKHSDQLLIEPEMTSVLERTVVRAS